MSEGTGLERQLEEYVRGKLAGARDVRVLGLDRIPGGASRETYRFRLAYESGEGPVERKLILRRDPEKSIMESERRIEFEAFRAFRDTPVPVPEMLWLEEQGGPLGSPFFISVEVAGFEANPMLLQEAPYVSLKPVIGRNKWRLLGEIAKQDPVAIGYDKLFPMPAPDQVWKLELDRWCETLDKARMRSEPIVDAAIRWLYRNPPPPPERVTVVHGDYRSGNFLFDREGGIRAVLDWEMTHLGDPLEDIAWGFLPMWYFKTGNPGGLLTRAESIAAWEEGSGMKVDPAALHWWDLFSCVKGQALWLTAGQSWRDMAKKETMLISACWMTLNAQDRMVLELMGKI